MRSLCARLYNVVEQKHRALHFYLGTSVTPYPGSGKRASISLRATCVLRFPPFTEHLWWVWLRLLHRAAVTIALFPRPFFWGPFLPRSRVPTQGRLVGTGTFLPPSSSITAWQASPRGPTPTLTAVCRGRGVRGSPKHSSRTYIHRLWVFFSQLPR